MTSHQPALSAELLAATLGHSAGLLGKESVEVRESHISWVFLVGERAYKLKKPIVLPFLDYGTPSRRLDMCREEVRLNRRLAPDLYLGVRGVALAGDSLRLTDADDPRAVDYVVEMRRYEERDTLAAAVGRGVLRRTDVDQVAVTLARFHAACAPAEVGGAAQERIGREVARNVEELLDIVEHRRDHKRFSSLARFAKAFVRTRAGEFDDRGARGLIRECHGDLRAEHVLLRPRVLVVDCVEFDAQLRTLDVADDLAFLVMDLAAMGGERFARELLAAYRSAGGDCGGDALVAFFAAHRALVRAKVVLVRGAQRPAVSAARGRASVRSRDLLGLAESFSWRARLPLAIVVCGVPASGKTFLAQALADLSRLPHLSSDVTRKRLAGVQSSRRAPKWVYAPEWNERTYAELGKEAAGEVAALGGVIVDATFRRRADRGAFARSFADSAPVLFVECLTPPSVLLRRAARRQTEPRRVSDADVELVRREYSAWEALDELPAGARVAMPTDRSLEEIVDDVLAVLDERMGTLPR